MKLGQELAGVDLASTFAPCWTCQNGTPAQPSFLLPSCFQGSELNCVYAGQACLPTYQDTTQTKELQIWQHLLSVLL